MGKGRGRTPHNRAREQQQASLQIDEGLSEINVPVVAPFTATQVVQVVYHAGVICAVCGHYREDPTVVCPICSQNPDELELEYVEIDDFGYDLLLDEELYSPADEEDDLEELRQYDIVHTLDGTISLEALLSRNYPNGIPGEISLEELWEGEDLEL